MLSKVSICRNPFALYGIFRSKHIGVSDPQKYFKQI